MRAFLSQSPQAAVPASLSLSSEEAAEVAGWGDRERALFLEGYQWLSAVTSRRLPVFGTDSEYQGILPMGIAAVMGITKSAREVLAALAPDVVGGVTELETASKDASMTSGSADEAVRRFRSLRDRAVQDLVEAGDGVEFEYYGDSPARPNVLLIHRVVQQGVAPEVSAVYSPMTPAELVRAGLRLEERFAQVGVPFARSTMGAPPAFPILGGIITLVLGVIGFFAEYHSVQERKGLNAAVMAACEELPPAERAECLSRILSANTLFSGIFGGEFPWTTLIVGGALTAAVVAFGPKLVEGLFGKERREKSKAEAKA